MIFSCWDVVHTPVNAHLQNQLTDSSYDLLIEVAKETLESGSDIRVSQETIAQKLRVIQEETRDVNYSPNFN